MFREADRASMMGPPIAEIRELSREVRSLLRTGITITTPAQCVTELVHNAIDAGATSVAVRINLPFYKIQVVDNGCGMPCRQLELIGERYMTSKCHSLDDLHTSLGSYGFRGEALASLREVSGMLSITSRPKCEGKSGHTYSKVFTHGKSHAACESYTERPSCGTTVTIQDFMYNMPIRQKRIKEAFDVEEIKSHLECIALMHPEVSFSLRNDSSGSMVLHTFLSTSVVKVFANLFGQQLAKCLGEVNYTLDAITVSGYIGKEVISQKTLQFVYINKRLVLKTKIHKLINMMLARSFMLKCKGPWREIPITKEIQKFLSFSPPKKEKYGIFILNITCPYSEYDICMDPKKTLVEFRNWGIVLQCVEDAVRNFLERENLTIVESDYDYNPRDAQLNSGKVSLLDEIEELERENALGVVNQKLNNTEHNRPLNGNFSCVEADDIDTHNIARAVHSFPAKRTVAHNKIDEEEVMSSNDRSPLEKNPRSNLLGTVETENPYSCSFPVGFAGSICGNEQHEDASVPRIMHRIISDASYKTPLDSKIPNSKPPPIIRKSRVTDSYQAQEGNAICLINDPERVKRQINAAKKLQKFSFTLGNGNRLTKDSHHKMKYVNTEHTDISHSKNTNITKTSKGDYVSSLKQRKYLNLINNTSENACVLSKLSSQIITDIRNEVQKSNSGELQQRSQSISVTDVNKDKTMSSENNRSNRGFVRHVQFAPSVQTHKSIIETNICSCCPKIHTNCVSKTIERRTVNIGTHMRSVRESQCGNTVHWLDPTCHNISNNFNVSRTCSNENSNSNSEKPFLTSSDFLHPLNPPRLKSSISCLRENSDENNSCENNLGHQFSACDHVQKHSSIHDNNFQSPFQCEQPMHDNANANQKNAVILSRKTERVAVKVNVKARWNFLSVSDTCSYDTDSTDVSINFERNVPEFSHNSVTDKCRNSECNIPPNQFSRPETIEKQTRLSFSDLVISPPSNDETRDILQNSKDLECAKTSKDNNSLGFSDKSMSLKLQNLESSEGEVLAEGNEIRLPAGVSVELENEICMYDAEKDYVNRRSEHSSEASTYHSVSLFELRKQCSKSSDFNESNKCVEEYSSEVIQSSVQAPKNCLLARSNNSTFNKHLVLENKTLPDANESTKMPVSLSTISSNHVTVEQKSVVPDPSSLPPRIDTAYVNLEPACHSINKHGTLAIQKEVAVDFSNVTMIEKNVKNLKNNNDQQLDYQLETNGTIKRTESGSSKLIGEIQSGMHISTNDNPCDLLPSSNIIPCGQNLVYNNHITRVHPKPNILPSNSLIGLNLTCDFLNDNSEQQFPSNRSKTCEQVLSEGRSNSLSTKSVSSDPIQCGQVTGSSDTVSSSSLNDAKLCNLKNPDSFSGSFACHSAAETESVKNKCNLKRLHEFEQKDAIEKKKSCSSNDASAVVVSTMDIDKSGGSNRNICETRSGYIVNDQIRDCEKCSTTLEISSSQGRNSEAHLKVQGECGGWKESVDPFGRKFYFHTESGAISCEAPVGQSERDLYHMTKRNSCLPKGMSPILQLNNKPEDCANLSTEEQQEVCDAMTNNNKLDEEASLVKWRSNRDQKEKLQADCHKLMEVLQIEAEDKMFYCDKEISTGCVQDVSRSAVKVYNVIHPYKFTKDILTGCKVLGQLDDKFIVTLVSLKAGKDPHLIVLFDQHAVHERIRLEKITEYHVDSSNNQVRSVEVDSPLELHLGGTEVRIMSSFEDEFERLGLKYRILDDSTVHINFVPACFVSREEREVKSRRTSVLKSLLESLIREHVDSLMRTRGVGSKIPRTIHSVLASEACRGAVKFGDPLSIKDCQFLLENLCYCSAPFQCAHGRPALVPIADLNRVEQVEKKVKKPQLFKLRKGAEVFT